MTTGRTNEDVAQEEQEQTVDEQKKIEKAKRDYQSEKALQLDLENAKFVWETTDAKLFVNKLFKLKTKEKVRLDDDPNFAAARANASMRTGSQMHHLLPFGGYGILNEKGKEEPYKFFIEKFKDKDGNEMVRCYSYPFPEKKEDKQKCYEAEIRMLDVGTGCRDIDFNIRKISVSKEGEEPMQMSQAEFIEELTMVMELAQKYKKTVNIVGNTKTLFDELPTEQQDYFRQWQKRLVINQNTDESFIKYFDERLERDFNKEPSLKNEENLQNTMVEKLKKDGVPLEGDEKLKALQNLASDFESRVNKLIRAYKDLGERVTIYKEGLDNKTLDPTQVRGMMVGEDDENHTKKAAQVLAQEYNEVRLLEEGLRAVFDKEKYDSTNENSPTLKDKMNTLRKEDPIDEDKDTYLLLKGINDKLRTGKKLDKIDPDAALHAIDELDNKTKEVQAAPEAPKI